MEAEFIVPRKRWVHDRFTLNVIATIWTAILVIWIACLGTLVSEGGPGPKFDFAMATIIFVTLTLAIYVNIPPLKEVNDYYEFAKAKKAMLKEKENALDQEVMSKLKSQIP